MHAPRARPTLHSVNYRRIVFGLVTAFGAARRAVCGPADSGDGRESGRAERDGEYDAEVRPRDGEACRGGSNTPWRTLTGMFDSAHAAIAPLASPARVMMPASAQTNAPSWRRLAPSAAAVAKVRRCSWRCFGRGSSRTISSRLSVCCSEPATTPVRADRTGSELGIVRSSPSATDRSACMTADTRPRPHVCVPGCHLVRQRDASVTASKRSSPPTSAPSTTKNTSPTNESTRSSDSARAGKPGAVADRSTGDTLAMSHGWATLADPSWLASQRLSTVRRADAMTRPLCVG